MKRVHNTPQESSQTQDQGRNPPGTEVANRCVVQQFNEQLTYSECLRNSLRDPNLLMPQWQNLGFLGDVEASLALGPRGPEYTIVRVPSEPEAWMELGRSRWPLDFMRGVANRANEVLLTKRCRICGVAPFVEVVPDMDRSGQFRLSAGCMHWSRSEWAPVLLKTLGAIRCELANIPA